MNPKTLRFLKFGLLPLVLATSDFAMATSDQYLVYFGTYTPANGKSKGIYVSRFDSTKGTLSAPELAVQTTNPSFLAIHPNGKYMYAVGEMPNFEGKKTGAVSAFVLERPSGKLSLLNQVTSGGPGPCHVAIDATGRTVIAANYSGGSVEAIPVLDNGKLGEPTCFIQHTGSSVHPKRQTLPHAHSSNLAPSNRFVFVCDLGLDKVMSYKLDAANAKLTPNDPPFATLPPGAGPRHFAFHPNGKFAYVINELACTMTTFAYDAERGAFKELQTTSTLPAGESVRDGYSTAEVRVHPNGKFVYGSNRGHDTIAVYEVAADGTLRLIQNQASGGKMPRNFNLDPSGRWLLAAHQNSDNVVLFQVDTVTGKLTPTGKEIELGAPVCVRFLPVE